MLTDSLQLPNNGCILKMPISRNDAMPWGFSLRVIVYVANFAASIGGNAVLCATRDLILLWAGCFRHFTSPAFPKLNRMRGDANGKSEMSRVQASQGTV